MGLFDHFPYTNFHELNLTWILNALKEIQTTMDQFVSINSIKYADPFQWNITSQYEKNTLVMNPNTGDAYLSVQPVPIGVDIHNTDYWTLVFNYDAQFNDILGSIASNELESATATVFHAKNSLLWVDGHLYIAIQDIPVSSAFVEDVNIHAVSVNDWVLMYWRILKRITATGDLGTLTNYDDDYYTGDWVWWNDRLCRITSDVTNGTTIISGTNIEEITLEQIKSEILTIITTDITTLKNNLEGSIAVNELDNTEATVALDAGVMVWVQDELYMTLLPISVGDTFVSGTNITPVDVNDFILNRIRTNRNRIKGSIAINELNSATATVSIPAGNMVWVQDELYMTLLPISVGDTFVSGTNITPIKVNDFVLSRINALVAIELSRFSTAGYKLSEKKFLFIGDSFGDSSNRGFNCWPEIMASGLGLDAAQWTNLCTDSAGIWGSTPPYTFIYQLENYSGDKSKITDIIMGEAMNDSFSDDINASQYNAVKQNLKDIVDYVAANYPKATLYVASIGNAIDVSPNIGVRVYKARTAFRRNFFKWCGEYGINILYGTEYALCGGLTWYLPDQIHPNLTGETMLGEAMVRAYLSKNADIAYYLKDNYVVYPTTNFTDQGNMTSDIYIQNETTRMDINNIGVNVTNGTVINQDFQFLASPDIWFNEQASTNGYIRLHGFNGITEQVLPTTFWFRGNRLHAHIYDLTGGSWVTSWTAGAGAYFTVEGLSITFNSDRLV